METTGIIFCNFSENCLDVFRVCPTNYFLQVGSTLRTAFRVRRIKCGARVKVVFSVFLALVLECCCRTPALAGREGDREPCLEIPFLGFNTYILIWRCSLDTA